VSTSPHIRPCRPHDAGAILAIVNAAAEAYRGVIPADRWRDSYMPRDELETEIAAGVGPCLTRNPRRPLTPVTCEQRAMPGTHDISLSQCFANRTAMDLGGSAHGHN
jgi:hypothetical protein